MGTAYPNVTRNSLFSYSTDGVTYTDMDCYEVTPPKTKRGKVDDTVINTSDDTRVYQGGWRDPGEVTAKLKFTKALYAALIGYDDAVTNLYWKVALPLYSTEVNASKVVFRGCITELGLATINTDEGNKGVIELTIQTSGKPTFTAGT